MVIGISLSSNGLVNVYALDHNSVEAVSHKGA